MQIYSFNTYNNYYKNYGLVKTHSNSSYYSNSNINFGKLKPEQVKEMTRLYRCGKNMNEIALVMGINADTVSKYLKKQSDFDETRKEHNKNLERKIISQQRFENIIEKYKQGTSVSEIAKELDCQIYNIYYYLHKLDNFKEIRKEHLTNKDKNVTTKIIEKYQQGIKISEIAKETNCTEANVLHHLQKSGIYKKPNKSNNKSAIIEMYRQGIRPVKIAAELGCTQNQVNYYLYRYDNFNEIQKEHNKNLERKIISQQRFENIIEMYRRGMSLNKIAAELGCTQNQVNYYLYQYDNFNEIQKEHKINKPAWKLTQIDENLTQIEEKYKQGIKVSEIAKEMNCTEANVLYRLHKLVNFSEIQKEHNKNLERKIISQQRFENIIEKYKQGTSVSEIAKELDCQIYNIYYHLHKLDNFEEIRKEHLTNKDKNVTTKIIEKYQQGIKISEIAKETNCTEANVLHHLQKSGIYKKPNKSNNKSAIIEKYKQGMKLTDIAKECNCTLSQVYNYIYNLPLNIFAEVETERKIHKSRKKETIIEMYKQGMNLAEIAKQFNCSVANISNYIRKSNNLDEIKQEHASNKYKLGKD